MTFQTTTTTAEKQLNWASVKRGVGFGSGSGSDSGSGSGSESISFF